MLGADVIPRRALSCGDISRRLYKRSQTANLFAGTTKVGCDIVVFSFLHKIPVGAK